MRKIIAGLICVIVFISTIVIIISLNGKQTAESDIQAILSDENMSTYDKVENIYRMAKDKKLECEDIKNRITDTLFEIYDVDIIVQQYFDRDEIKTTVEDYYDSCLNKINEKMDLSKYICTIKYTTGSYSSIQMSIYEFENFNSLYEELSETLVFLEEELNLVKSN